eukprot:UN24845
MDLADSYHNVGVFISLCSAKSWVQTWRKTTHQRCV